MKKPNDWLKYDKRDGRKGRGKKAIAKAERQETKYTVTEALKQMAEFKPVIPLEYYVASRKAIKEKYGGKT